MKTRIGISIGITICMLGLGCTPQQIAGGLTQLAALDALCVGSFTATIHPPTGGATYGTVDFAAVVGNPNEAVSGSIKLLMGVDGSNLPGPYLNTSAQSKAPSFDTPVATTYLGKTSQAYTSPALITMVWNPNAVYNIEIHKWMAGENTWDAKPCHNFYAKNLTFQQ